MSRSVLVLVALASLAGCASATEPVAAEDGALTAVATATRPTGATAETDKHNRLSIGMLVDPPTGAGWAAPALMIAYRDAAHAFGGAQSLTAHVTVHLSAPDRHESQTVGLRLDGTGAFQAPLFVELADIEHVEGVELSVGDGHRWDAADEHHERSYTLGGVRADADDAASVGPFDRIAVRGVSRTARYDGAGLALAVDVTPAVFTSEEVPGYDGKGQAFALVPHGTAWDRVALTGTTSVASPDRAAIAAKGIAFGITTNMGTVWLQTPTGNVRP